MNGAAESDEQLWRRVRAGEGELFGVIFDRHGGRVLTHCRRWTESRADAEDLASMVFLEALRRASKARFVDGSALPWLLVVATNLARNQSRARRRYRALLARLPGAIPQTDFADDVAADVDARERVAQLREALGTLRPAERDVVALCDLADLSYEEAASALDVPVGTVRSRLSRARAKLRISLAPNGDPPTMLHVVTDREAAG